MILMEGPSWRWYDRIDSTVILGAIPFKSQTKEVHVLCTTPPPPQKTAATTTLIIFGVRAIANRVATMVR